MSETNRASGIAVFAIAMLIVVFVGTWYSIYVLGQSEGSIGNDFDNLKMSALFFLPIVALSSAGYWLGGVLFRGAPRRAGIIASAIASGALVFAWPLVVPLLPSALNIVGFGVYCLVLGSLSRIVASRVASRVLPNNAFERTVSQRGRTVLALECALAGAEWSSWPAAQLGR